MSDWEAFAKAVEAYLSTVNRFLELETKSYDAFLESTILCIKSTIKGYSVTIPTAVGNKLKILIHNWLTVHYGFCLMRLFLLYGICTNGCVLHDTMHESYPDNTPRKGGYRLTYQGKLTMSCDHGLQYQFSHNNKKVSLFAIS